MTKQRRLTMVINYDIDKLQDTLKHFYNVTGINLRFIKDYYNPMPSPGDNNKYCSALKNTAGGDRRCRHSDMELIKKCRESKKHEYHICHAGLTDAVIPIIHKEMILGYIILGQMKTIPEFSPEKIAHLGVDIDAVKKLYDELPYYDESKIESIIEIISILVKHIILENILKPNIIQNIELATEYIESNLSKPLNIKDISKNINLYKSTLYNEFHKHFGCTVNEYINRRRVEKSIEYLDTTDKSVEEISQIIGFSSASYYSVIFKKIKGVSPIKYKQSSLR